MSKWSLEENGPQEKNAVNARGERDQEVHGTTKD